jgi:ABC-type nickel/cobalt efflux system permease component RcnA
LTGLEQVVSGPGDGGSGLVVPAVALLLGLRHAADPDHLVAVSTLLVTGPDRRARRAGRLGLAWGLGHATTLVLLGAPVVLVGSYLPEAAQRAAEALAGALIMALAVQLLLRWRRTRPHTHAHAHGALVHRHLHPHGLGEEHAHVHAHAHEHALARGSVQSFGIGLVHGAGGSAAVAILLLASLGDRAEAAAALLLFATVTTLSMTVLSLALGYALALGPVRSGVGRLTPVLGALSLAFGTWYALGAVGL